MDSNTYKNEKVKTYQKNDCTDVTHVRNFLSDMNCELPTPPDQTACTILRPFEPLPGSQPPELL